MKHERGTIDAPDNIDGVTSSDDYDRSNLAGLYPEPPVDNRPLLKSDEERTALYARQLRDQIRGIRRFAIRLGAQIWLPLYLTYVAVMSYFILSLNEDERTMFVTASILIGSIIVGVSIASYVAIMNRFRIHGVNGGLFLFLMFVGLGLVALPLYNLTLITDNAWANLGIFGIASLVVSILIAKVYLIVMTIR